MYPSNLEKVIKKNTLQLDHGKLVLDIINIYTPEKILNLLNLSCKECYNLILLRDYTSSPCIKKWCEEKPMLSEIICDQWETIFKLPNLILKECKIISFQYECLHQIINCK